MLRRTMALGGTVVLMIAAIGWAQQPRGSGRGGFGGFGGPGGFQASGAVLLGIPEVQKELQLSDEQRAQVAELASDVQEQPTKIAAR